MIALWLWLAAGAAAQDNPPLPSDLDYSFDSERFRPHGDHYGYVLTEGASTLKHLQVSAGLWANYSQDPINFALDGDRIHLFESDFDYLDQAVEEGDGVIDQRAVADLQVGLGLADRFSLVIDVPVLLWQEGFEPAYAHDPNTYNDELVPSGLQDIRVTPKVVVVDRDTAPVGVALLARITAPTGTPISFIGEGAPTFTPMAVLEFSDAPVHKREYQVRGALNLGYKLRQTANYGPDLLIESEFVYRGAVAVHMEPVELGVDVSGIYGTLPVTSPVEVLPWAQLNVGDLFSVNVGGGVTVNPGLGSPDWRVHGGFTLAPSFNPRDLDRDGDGIQNNKDECPNIPEDLDGFEDLDGCPEDDNDKDGIVDSKDVCPDDPEDYDRFKDEDGCPDRDNDGDGIVDKVDLCPLVPEVFNGYQDDDGCPDEQPVRDSDGDGLLDNVDRCPYDPEDFDGFQDDDGCPERDNDQDTIIDTLDDCPLEPEDFDGFEDLDGCPEYDNDLDTIPDSLDDCPDDPETMNGYQDVDGCPDEAPPKLVFIEKERIVIKDRIYFEFNEAIIQPVSFALMDEIAELLLDNPDLLLIQVQGHTDSAGDDVYNLDLSQRRAQAVVTYLINQQVEPGRVEAMGFGELKPIDTNKTDEGRANNRRVEFHILKRESGG